VKMGVAKKLEGNPAHPVNQGALCPRGQAAIQVTYHPDRIARPLKRTGPRGTGQFQEVSWDEALSELLSRLDGLAAANDQRALAFLTRPRHSRRHELAAQFLGRFGAPPPLLGLVCAAGRQGRTAEASPACVSCAFPSPVSWRG